MSKKLTGRLLSLAQISLSQKKEMFSLFQKHYENVTWELYLSDLQKKDYVILLEHYSQICGFSTQQVFRFTLEDQPLRILFSGDTIIAPEYWGEQELVRSWCTFAGQVLAQQPEIPLYWYLLTKGYRTYLYLPLFFRTFYPCHREEIPLSLKKIRDFVSLKLYPNAYNAEKGLLEFEHSQGNLTGELASVPETKQKNAHVQFFLQANPHFAQGTELICLAEISIKNMRSFAATYVEKGQHIPL